MVRSAHAPPVTGRQRSTQIARRLTPAERELIAPFRKPRSESGFLHVTYDNSGRGWAAKVRPGVCPFTARGERLGPARHCGYAPTPEMAALLVADYYDRRFGPEWGKVVHARFAAGYRIEQEPGEYYFRLTVWEAGHEVILTPDGPLDPGGKPDDPCCLGFATVECARNYLLRRLREEYGVFAPLALWRYAKLPEPGRVTPGRAKPTYWSGLPRVPKCGWKLPKGRRSATPPFLGGD